MSKFEYSNPAVIHFGSDSHKRLGEVLQDEQIDSVHVVSTRSVVNSEFFSEVRKEATQLGSASVSTVEGHVPLNGPLEAALQIRRSGAQAVVAIGGGSSIDAAKLSAYAATAPELGDNILPAEFHRLITEPSTRGALPVFAIPTTLSAAELYGDAGFTAHDTGFKVGVRNAAMTPRSVFYDSRAAAETPQRLWASTGLRAVDHAMETLLAPYTNPLTETLTTAGLRELLTVLPRFADGVGTEEDRLAGYAAAWKSYTVPRIASSGPSHIIGRIVGAKNSVPHGITSCVVLPKVLRFRYGSDEQARLRLDSLGQQVQGSADGAALIERIEATVELLGLPSRFSRDQIGRDSEQETAAIAAEQTGIALEEMRQILAACIE